MRKFFVLCAVCVAVGLGGGCGSLPDLPDIPDIPIPPVTPPATNTPPDDSEWGAVIKLERGDPDCAVKEWRSGSGPQVSILDRNADWWLGEWAKAGVTRTANADGSVTLTAKPIQSPISGRWFKPYSWRVKTDSSADIFAESCVVPKSAQGDVTRLRYECREKK